MIEYATRPLTDDERARLSEPVTEYRPPLGEIAADGFVHVVGCGFLGLMLGTLCGLALETLGASPRAIAAVMAAGAAAGAVVGRESLLRAARARRAAAERREARRAELLTRGVVDVLRVRAYGVVVLDEWEDWGEAYFFSVGPMSVLFVAGADWPGGDVWPCRAFDYTLRRPDGSDDIWLTPVIPAPGSPPLAPERVVFFDDLPDGYLPGDGEVFAASLETLEDDLRRIASGEADEDAAEDLPF